MSVAVQTYIPSFTPVGSVLKYREPSGKSVALLPKLQLSAAAPELEGAPAPLEIVTPVDNLMSAVLKAEIASRSKP